MADTTVTLNQYIHRLNLKDKALICNAMRLFGGYPDAHNGLLPFFRMTSVADAIAKTYAMAEKKRPWANLWGLLELDRHVMGDKYQVIHLWLDDVKVYRRWPNPHRGFAVPGVSSITTTAGLAWNLGKKDYIPAKVTVPRYVSLTRRDRNHWMCFAHKADIDKVVTYLQDHLSLYT